MAQILNRDANLRDMLHRMENTDTDLLPLEIKPYREHQCIRIRPRESAHRPASAFPTPEAFEAYDRIAQHIRSIANARP